MNSAFYDGELALTRWFGFGALCTSSPASASLNMPLGGCFRHHVDHQHLVWACSYFTATGRIAKAVSSS